MRINRFLSSCGVASRRGSEALIEDGRVKVNGSVLTTLATFVEPGRDRVEVDGRVVTLPREFTYLLLHKPVGVITTASDPEGRMRVTELVPTEPRVFPVGRLDYDTSGALLMTNDGGLAHRLLHPRYKVEKVYETTVTGELDDSALERLRRGVLMGTRPTAPAVVEVLTRRPNRTKVRLTIHEGRNRQVRRMMEAVGHQVLELKRLRFGPVALATLEEGTFRPLTADEVKALRRATARAASSTPPRRRKGMHPGPKGPGKPGRRGAR